MSYQYKYPRPSVTVDALVFHLAQKDWEILLIQRGNEPFKGSWALPGGFVDEHEDLLPAAIRELQEETSIQTNTLKQLAAFGKPGRDPRGWTISVAFWGIINTAQKAKAKAADDAASAKWFKLKECPKLAFDHDEIIKHAQAHLAFLKV